MATPQIPAKPAKAKRIKTEDFSTPYKPPVDTAPREPEPLTPRFSLPAKRAATQHNDLSGFVICDDPLLPRRALSEGMYTKLFAELKPGKCIKCEPKDVFRTGHALRAYVKKKKLAGVAVKSTRDYGDGMGRVFLVKAAT